MGPTTSVPYQACATGMNEPQFSRQIRFWLVQAKLSNRLQKNNGGTQELRVSACLRADTHRQARGAQQENTPAGYQRETGWTEEGSRSEVRGFRNFEPRISNFGSRLFHMSRASRVTVCGADELFQHPAKTTLFGPSERGSLTAEPFRRYKI
jgi:hypothetical protein